MTAGSMDEARTIAADLVDRRLAACVNLVPGIRSIYRWQGEVADDAEVVMFAKTRTDLVEAVTARVKELHSYDCPCIVALPISAGNGDFLDWIAAETA
jgi:periplasmic divalent cation tolerance protein